MLREISWLRKSQMRIDCCNETDWISLQPRKRRNREQSSIDLSQGRLGSFVIPERGCGGCHSCRSTVCLFILVRPQTQLAEDVHEVRGTVCVTRVA